MKDVVIHISSVHDCTSEEPNVIDFTTDGLYTCIDGTFCLSYSESDVTGLDGTRTSLMITPEQLVIDRDGLVTSRMIFHTGEKHSFLFDTPMGSATMSLTTRRLDMNFDDMGGNLEIEYVLDIEHTVINLNKFKLKACVKNQIGEQ